MFRQSIEVLTRGTHPFRQGVVIATVSFSVIHTHLYKSTRPIPANLIKHRVFICSITDTPVVKQI